MSDFVKHTDVLNNEVEASVAEETPVDEAEADGEGSEDSQTKIDENYVNQFDSEKHPSNFAVLKLAVDKNEPELAELYKTHVENHNISLMRTIFPNSGFDLFVPHDAIFTKDFVTKFVDLKIKTEMIYCDKSMEIEVEDDDGEEMTLKGISYSCGYYVYPRSSMSKTPLMLANHVGIIDSGYRGNLMAAVRKLPHVNASAAETSQDSNYTVEKHTRLFQICHPTLCPVFVVLVDESELNSSERGEGGFGSTGAKGVAK
jgi:dUTP pyrophosphatase